MELEKVLKNIPPKGTRLTNGLGVKVTTMGDLTVISCSREGAEPSLQEMEIVARAGTNAFGAKVAIVEKTFTEIATTHKSICYVARIYIPHKPIEVKQMRPQALPLPLEETAYVYD